MKAMLNELLPVESRRRLPAAPLSYQQFNQHTFTEWGSTEAFLKTDFETQPEDEDTSPTLKKESDSLGARSLLPFPLFGVDAKGGEVI